MASENGNLRVRAGLHWGLMKLKDLNLGTNRTRRSSGWEQLCENREEGSEGR